MTESQFWHVLHQLDWDADDDNKVLAPAIEALASTRLEEIRAFDDILAEKLYSLDGEAYAKNIGEHSYTDDESRHFSVDLFLYARCYVVAQGVEFYRMVLNDPEAMPKDRDFEALLELPGLAYKKQTGEPYTHIPPVSYETFSNTAGWRET